MLPIACLNRGYTEDGFVHLLKWFQELTLGFDIVL